LRVTTTADVIITIRENDLVSGFVPAALADFIPPNALCSSYSEQESIK
jgi:hypothetical protein